MPTPFYHLNVANELVKHPDLAEEWRDFLDEHVGAFLFGNTAPDVQTVSGQPRSATHFFDLPLGNYPLPPWAAIFEQYPGLRQPQRLSPEQAAFLAGYLCHLQADWIWIKQIFLPVFSKRSPWGTLSERLYLHNVLRSYLDLEILPGLGNGTAACLKRISPTRWLPFVEDIHLHTWREFLAQQLEPGASVKTVEVFAARQGVPPEEYYQLLQSEERMEAEVFSHLPRENLDEYRRLLVGANIDLIQAYLTDAFSSTNPSMRTVQ